MSSSPQNPKAPAPLTTVPPTTTSATPTPSTSVEPQEINKATATWRLPEGIERHIEDGIIKASVGAALGGIFAVALLKAGKGNRMVPVMMGIGVGLGSSYERAAEHYYYSNSTRN